MEQFSFDDKARKHASPIPDQNRKSASLSLVKVYLWFAIGLLVTGVIALALPMILASVMTEKNEDTVASVYIVMMVVSIIALLPSMIIVHIQGFRKNKVMMLIGYFIYAVAMGVLLSAVFLAFAGTEAGIQTLSIAFFVTGGIFFLCGLFGALTKKHDLKLVYPVLFSIVLGIAAISLVNVFLGSSLVYWVADFILFAVMIVVVMLDMHNIHKIADSGAFDDSTNLAIYCAFNLYTDFIWIFIKIAYYIALFGRKK